MTDDLKAGALFPITIQDVIMPLTEDLIYNKIGIQMPAGCRGGYEWPVVEAVEAQIAGEAEELDDQKINLDKVPTVTQRTAETVVLDTHDAASRVFGRCLKLCLH